jgi:hypothetical protein
MSTPATIIVYGIALYAACGVVLALAFVAVGISRVQPAPVSLGARILILPGAVALWPYVLMRWLGARGGS